MPENQAQAAAENTSLDPRALQLLLEAVDLATKRGAFNIQEVGNIANAYDHTSTVLANLSKAQGQQGQLGQVEEPPKQKKSNKGDKE